MTVWKFYSIIAVILLFLYGVVMLITAFPTQAVGFFTAICVGGVILLVCVKLEALRRDLG